MRRRVLGLLCGCLLASVSGCGGAKTPEVTRTLDGAARRGYFVSPYSYEWYVRGELAMERGDFEGAADAFERALLGPEEDPYVIARLSEALDGAGRTAEAMERLSEAVAKWPTSEALLIAQGRLAERQGRTGRALGHYADASKVAPTSEEPVLLRVALLRASGRDGEAVAVLERFLHRCWRDCLAAHRARLELTVTMGTGEEVTAHASALLAAAPVDRPFVVRLAEDALARGDAGVAAHLLDALALSGDTIALRMRVLVARGQTEEAESLLARARSEALVTSEQQASLLLEMGRPARALEVLGHDSSEHSTHEQFLVGRALLALGEPRRAAQILGRIPQGSRNYEEAEHLLKTIAADSGSSRPPVGQ